VNLQKVQEQKPLQN